MIKKIILSFLLLSCAAVIRADIIPASEINPDNIDKFGGSMYQYLDPHTKLTPPPKGFKPFYLSHYGRHGSRYLLETQQYERPYMILKDAYDKGVLTDFGKTVLDRVEKMMTDARGRLGDLTTKGMEQHKGITRRMMENYPMLFGKNGYVFARATTSHRVIVSMLSGLSELYRLRPNLKIKYDASNREAAYLNTEEGVSSYKNSSEKNVGQQKFYAANPIRPERLMMALFKDTTFVTRYEMKTEIRRFGPQPANTPREYSVRLMDASETLYNGLYDLAANMQSHDLGFNLNDVFTYDEWYTSFTHNNYYWYSVSAFSPLTGNVVPYGHSNLLANFLDCADEAIAGNGVTVDLRYGHDTTLFPFLCLLGVNDCEWSVDDFSRIADKWVDYDIVHMGSNLQMIFYRNKAGKVIVKFLLNEEEALIDIDFYKDEKGREFPYYYDWNEVEAYYRAKLEWWKNFQAEKAAAN